MESKLKFLVEINDYKHRIIINNNKSKTNNSVIFDEIYEKIQQIDENITSQTHSIELFDNDFNEYVLITDGKLFIENLSRFRVSQKSNKTEENQYSNESQKVFVSDLKSDSKSKPNTICSTNAQNIDLVFNNLDIDLENDSKMHSKTYSTTSQNNIEGNGVLKENLLQMNLEIDKELYNCELLNAIEKYKHIILDTKHYLLYKLWFNVKLDLEKSQLMRSYIEIPYCKRQFKFLLKQMSYNVMKYETYEQVLENFPLFDLLIKIPLIRFIYREVYHKIIEMNRKYPFLTHKYSIFEHKFPIFDAKHMKSYRVLLQIIESSFNENLTDKSDETLNWKLISDRFENSGFNVWQKTDIKVNFVIVIRIYELLVQYSLHYKFARKRLQLFDTIHKMNANLLRNENIEELEFWRKSLDSKEEYRYKRLEEKKSKGVKAMPEIFVNEDNKNVTKVFNVTNNRELNSTQSMSEDIKLSDDQIHAINQLSVSPTPHTNMISMSANYYTPLIRKLSNLPLLSPELTSHTIHTNVTQHTLNTLSSDLNLGHKPTSIDNSEINVSLRTRTHLCQHHSSYSSLLNSHLCNIIKIPSPNCRFCFHSPETSNHLFKHCLPLTHLRHSFNISTISKWRAERTVDLFEAFGINRGNSRLGVKTNKSEEIVLHALY